MADLTVSTDVDNFMGSADTAAMRAAAEVDMRTDVNGAVSIGDLSGNARGADAINIQTRAGYYSDQVASGQHSIAIGNFCTASGFGATASGYYTMATGNESSTYGSGSSATSVGSTASGAYSTASGSGSTAIGYYSSASGNNSTASGSYSYASGNNSTASGTYSTASGNNSTASGTYARTTVNNTTEIGYWSDGSTRGGAIRAHGTGMVAMTIQNRSTAFGDGGATAGSEADNTVIREGIAFRRNGNEILIDLNIAGTVTTLSLGTAS